MFEQMTALLGLDFSEATKVATLEGSDAPVLERIEDRGYVSFPELGLSLVLSAQDRVDAVHLHGADGHGFSAWRGELPDGMTWAMSRSEVRSVWGEPKEKGEAQRLPVLGNMPGWDAFLRGTVRVHVEYKLEGAGISLITLGDAPPA